MIESIVIRPARIEDGIQICNFLSDLEEEDFDYTVFSDLYEKNISSINNIYLVAVSDDSVVGYISCHGQTLLHHVGKVFEIQELYVDQNYRNRNVGKLLVETLEERLKSIDYKSLEVTPNKTRIRAHHFYTECGFEQTHLKFTKRK